MNTTNTDRNELEEAREFFRGMWLGLGLGIFMGAAAVTIMASILGGF